MGLPEVCADALVSVRMNMGRRNLFLFIFVVVENFGEGGEIEMLIHVSGV